MCLYIYIYNVELHFFFSSKKLKFIIKKIRKEKYFKKNLIEEKECQKIKKTVTYYQTLILTQLYKFTSVLKDSARDTI